MPTEKAMQEMTEISRSQCDENKWSAHQKVAPQAKKSMASQCAKRKRSKKEPEAVLYELLKSLSPLNRRSILEHSFSEAQRLRLETWIRHFKARASVKAGEKSAGTHPLPPSLMRRGCAQQKQRRQPGRSKTGVFGLHMHRRKQRTMYRASVSAGPFRLTTGYMLEQEEALTKLKVLLRLRDFMIEAACHEAQDLEHHFRAAVANEMAPSDQAQYYFYGTVSGFGRVSRFLYTPCYSVGGSGLDQGLSAWRQLTEAVGKEATLDELRSIHSSVWMEAGLCSKRVDARWSELETALASTQKRQAGGGAEGDGPTACHVMPARAKKLMCHGGRHRTPNQSGSCELSPMEDVLQTQRQEAKIHRILAKWRRQQKQQGHPTIKVLLPKSEHRGSCAKDSSKAIG